MPSPKGPLPRGKNISYELLRRAEKVVAERLIFNDVSKSFESVSQNDSFESASRDIFSSEDILARTLILEQQILDLEESFVEWTRLIDKGVDMSQMAEEYPLLKEIIESETEITILIVEEISLLAEREPELNQGKGADGEDFNDSDEFQGLKQTEHITVEEQEDARPPFLSPPPVPVRAHLATPAVYDDPLSPTETSAMTSTSQNTSTNTSTVTSTITSTGMPTTTSSPQNGANTPLQSPTSANSPGRREEWWLKTCDGCGKEAGHRKKVCDECKKPFPEKKGRGLPPSQGTRNSTRVPQKTSRLTSSKKGEVEASDRSVQPTSGTHSQVSTTIDSKEQKKERKAPMTKCKSCGIMRHTASKRCKGCGERLERKEKTTLNSNANPNRARKSSCGKCENCLKPDCGKCKNCVNRPVWHQRCECRRCIAKGGSEK